MKSIIVALALSLSACATTQNAPSQTSAAKIIIGAGHGSGVYIGNGIILTAAHVVMNIPTRLGIQDMTVKSSSGGQQTGRVLWFSNEYDVAAILVKDTKEYRAALLTCIPSKVGDSIITIGSPLNDDFLRINGTVAGVNKFGTLAKKVTVAAMPIAPGSSGGGVFNEYGQVIGIVSQVMVSSLGLNSLSQTGISYYVPSDMICELMGRV
jgi:serine protease Do